MTPEQAANILRPFMTEGPTVTWADLIGVAEEYVRLHRLNAALWNELGPMEETAQRRVAGAIAKGVKP